MAAFMVNVVNKRVAYSTYYIHNTFDGWASTSRYNSHPHFSAKCENVSVAIHLLDGLDAK